jgi:hypothetical protein
MRQLAEHVAPQSHALSRDGYVRDFDTGLITEKGEHRAYCISRGTCNPGPSWFTYPLFTDFSEKVRPSAR